jgi:hypothetical protein
VNAVRHLVPLHAHIVQLALVPGGMRPDAPATEFDPAVGDERPGLATLSEAKFLKLPANRPML